MKKFTIEHGGNIKIHFENEKSVKDYIERLGRQTVIVYEHKVVFDRTASSIKVDRL